MRFAEPNCPRCHEPASHTVDWIPGSCWLKFDEKTGEADYSGDGTEIHWDGSTNDADLDRDRDLKVYGRSDIPEHAIRLGCRECSEEWTTVITNPHPTITELNG